MLLHSCALPVPEGLRSFTFIFLGPQSPSHCLRVWNNAIIPPPVSNSPDKCPQTWKRPRRFDLETRKVVENSTVCFVLFACFYESLQHFTLKPVWHILCKLSCVQQKCGLVTQMSKDVWKGTVCPFMQVSQISISSHWRDFHFTHNFLKLVMKIVFLTMLTCVLNLLFFPFIENKCSISAVGEWGITYTHINSMFFVRIFPNEAQHCYHCYIV